MKNELKELNQTNFAKQRLILVSNQAVISEAPATAVTGVLHLDASIRASNGAIKNLEQPVNADGHGSKEAGKPRVVVVKQRAFQRHKRTLTNLNASTCSKFPTNLSLDHTRDPGGEEQRERIPLQSLINVNRGNGSLAKAAAPSKEIQFYSFQKKCLQLNPRLRLSQNMLLKSKKERSCNDENQNPSAEAPFKLATRQITPHKTVGGDAQLAADSSVVLLGISSFNNTATNNGKQSHTTENGVLNADLPFDSTAASRVCEGLTNKPRAFSSYCQNRAANASCSKSSSKGHNLAAVAGGGVLK